MLVVGCPANNREWIVKHWVSHVCRAAEHAEISDVSCYMLIPESSKETQDAFQEACATNGMRHYLVTTDETPRADVRKWNMSRYEQMAELRNLMLRHVRLLEPDFFLSLDSDILIGRSVISNMVAGLDSFDAIGSKCWLHPTSRNIVNYANLGKAGQLQRQDHKGVIRVDVLMAIKLMSPDAYWVDYEAHKQGEDIGWSNAAREKGLRLGWDGTSVSKHCMSPAALQKIDERVGW